MLEYYERNIKKKGDSLVVLYGASKQKETNSALAKLEEKAEMIFMVQAKHFRAKDVYDIAEYVGFSKYPSKFRKKTLILRSF